MEGREMGGGKMRGGWEGGEREEGGDKDRKGVEGGIGWQEIQFREQNKLDSCSHTLLMSKESKESSSGCAALSLAGVLSLLFSALSVLGW